MQTTTVLGLALAPSDPDAAAAPISPAADQNTARDLAAVAADSATPSAPAAASPRDTRHYDPVVLNIEAEEADLMADASGTENKNVNRGRIGAYFTQEEAGRIRAAYVNGWVLGEENAGTLSDFIKSEILAAVAELERRHNKGKPWKALPAGAVRVVTHQQIADKKAARVED